MVFMSNYHNVIIKFRRASGHLYSALSFFRLRFDFSRQFPLKISNYFPKD